MASKNIFLFASNFGEILLCIFLFAKFSISDPFILTFYMKFKFRSNRIKFTSNLIPFNFNKMEVSLWPQNWTFWSRYWKGCCCHIPTINCFFTEIFIPCWSFFDWCLMLISEMVWDSCFKTAVPFLLTKSCDKWHFEFHLTQQFHISSVCTKESM